MVSVTTLVAVCVIAAVAILVTATQASIPRRLLAGSAPPLEGTAPVFCTYLSGTGRFMGELITKDVCTKKNYWLVYCPQVGNSAIDWSQIPSSATPFPDVCNKNTGAVQSDYFINVIGRRDSIIGGLNDGQITDTDKRDKITLEAAEQLGYSCRVDSAGDRPANSDGLPDTPLVDFLHSKVVWEFAQKYSIMVSRLRTTTSDPATNCQEFPVGCGIHRESGTIGRGISDDDSVDLSSIVNSPHTYGIAADINCKEPKVEPGHGCSTATNAVLSKVRNKGFTIIQECTTNTIGRCSNGANQVIHIDLVDRTVNPYAYGGTDKIYYNCDFTTHASQ